MSLHPGAGYTFLVMALTAFLTARLAKTERRNVGTAFSLFLTSLALLAAGGGLRDLGFEVAAASVRSIAILAEGLCVIYLTAVLVFRALLPLARLVTPRIIHDVVIAAAWVIWGVVLLRYNKVDLTSIVATSAVVTAVVAFSLQETLGNILGGIAIQLDQSIQVGDWIQVDGMTGRVCEIRWRYTSLETRDWETVVVPNSHLVKNNFQVLGRRHGEPVRWRRTVYFNVDFRYAPSQVIDVVQAAVRATEIPRVAQVPEPICLMMDFGDSSAQFAVRYWLDDLMQDDPVDSDVRQVIYFSLRRAGIDPSIPAQAIFLTEENEERRLSKQVRTVQERVEALRGVDVFESLEPEELQTLARRLHHSPFARGALMTRQGAEANWLYLMIEGRADVLVEGPEGEPAPVAELGPGSFFGEMGLMTGEPRAATVIARTRVDAYRLDKSAFEEVLRSRPALAEDISSVLAQRRTELDMVREQLDTEAARRRLSATRSDLLERIQAFFGLDSPAPEPRLLPSTPPPSTRGRKARKPGSNGPEVL